jgi:hypothetical protein
LELSDFVELSIEWRREIKMFRFASLFTSLALALMEPLVAVQATGTIEGIVVVDGSSTPVPRATLTLTTTNGRQVATSVEAHSGNRMIHARWLWVSGRNSHRVQVGNLSIAIVTRPAK